MSRPPKAVSDYMAKIGKKGGEATGAVKKRSTEHYKKAAAKRWAKEEGAEVKTQSIVVGNKFKTPTGIWEVIRTRPGGVIELFNKGTSCFQDLYHREVRSWDRVPVNQTCSGK